MPRLPAALACLLALPGCFYTLEDDDDDDGAPAASGWGEPPGEPDGAPSEPDAPHPGGTFDTGTGDEETQPDTWTTYDGFDLYSLPEGDGGAPCSVGWSVTGEPASATCDGCIWAFTVWASPDDRYADPEGCPATEPFTSAYATDGATLFYAYGADWVPLAAVERWDAEALDYNFRAWRDEGLPDGGTAEVWHFARVR